MSKRSLEEDQQSDTVVTTIASFEDPVTPPPKKRAKLEDLTPQKVKHKAAKKPRSRVRTRRRRSKKQKKDDIAPEFVTAGELNLYRFRTNSDDDDSNIESSEIDSSENENDNTNNNTPITFTLLSSESSSLTNSPNRSKKKSKTEKKTKNKRKKQSKSTKKSKTASKSESPSKSESKSKSKSKSNTKTNKNTKSSKSTKAAKRKQTKKNSHNTKKRSRKEKKYNDTSNSNSSSNSEEDEDSDVAIDIKVKKETKDKVEKALESRLYDYSIGKDYSSRTKHICNSSMKILFGHKKICINLGKLTTDELNSETMIKLKENGDIEYHVQLSKLFDNDSITRIELEFDKINKMTINEHETTSNVEIIIEMNKLPLLSKQISNKKGKYLNNKFKQCKINGKTKKNGNNDPTDGELSKYCTHYIVLDKKYDRATTEKFLDVIRNHDVLGDFIDDSEDYEFDSEKKFRKRKKSGQKKVSSEKIKKKANSKTKMMNEDINVSSVSVTAESGESDDGYPELNGSDEEWKP